MKGQSEQKKELLQMLAEMEKEDAEKIDETAWIAERIAMVEYYYGVRIDGHYPIMKRFNQQEHLVKAFELDAKRFGLSK